MKTKIFITVFMAFLCAGGWAQSAMGGKAGQVYIGVNILPYTGAIPLPTGISFGSQGSSSGSGSRYMILTLNGEGGYFIVKGLELGVCVLFIDIYSWSSGGWNLNVTLGPGAEVMYLFDLGSFIAPYVKAEAYYLHRDVSSSSGSSSYANGFLLLALAGTKFFFNEKVALDAGAYFSYYRMVEGDGDSSDGCYCGISVGMNLFF